jgi:L-lactate dehydrogenase complex protein LldG
MNAREQILKNIISNKPESRELPVTPSFKDSATSEKFKQSLISIGGNVYETDDFNNCEQIIGNVFTDLKIIASNVVKSSVSITYDTDKSILNSVELAVLQAQFGIAENGAIFISERNMMNRALPFITQHLVIILERKNILSNMHDAFNVISPADDYGVFIAGPSKTADIEQSLVIGAHGAKSLTVILFGKID